MELDVDFTGAEWLALASAVVTVLAAFLPWMTVEAGPAAPSTAGVDGRGFLTLLLALLAIVVVVLLDWTDRGALVTAAVGVVVLLVGLWKVVDVGGATSPGIGLYLTVLGGFGILLAGAWGHRTGGRESRRGTAL